MLVLDLVGWIYLREVVMPSFDIECDWTHFLKLETFPSTAQNHNVATVFLTTTNILSVDHENLRLCNIRTEVCCYSSYDTKDTSQDAGTLSDLHLLRLLTASS